jgi:hypothetical protein
VLVRRALGGASVITSGASAVVVWLGKPWSALALILTACVAIINGLWLEGLLAQVLQPGRARVTRWAAALGIGRLGLWGVLFWLLYLLGDRVELWAVAVGVTCVLVALLGAGVAGGDLDRRKE